jgi:hypothetical protein
MYRHTLFTIMLSMKDNSNKQRNVCMAQKFSRISSVLFLSLKACKVSGKVYRTKNVCFIYLYTFSKTSFHYSMYLLSYNSDTNQNTHKMLLLLSNMKQNWKMSKISVKLPSITFYESIFSSYQVVRCGQSDIDKITVTTVKNVQQTLTK